VREADEPGVALVRADDALVVCAAPEPPSPKPPPRPPDAPSPTPTEGSRPRLRPEDPRLKPTPRSTPAETETPRDAERLTARIGLLDGPMPIPPQTLTPTPGSIVAVTATQPFRMLPPLSHVAVTGLLKDVGIVTRLPRLEVGIRLLMIPVKLVGMARVIDVEGNDTPTPAPIVTDAATLADKLIPIGMLGTSEVTPGRAEIRDEAPSNTAPGM
jgi:hypothetical protein